MSKKGIVQAGELFLSARRKRARSCYGVPMRAPVRPAVLFVCLGNICRSPLAEGAFRRVAGDAGLDVEIESAGTGDWHVGKAPDPRAIRTAHAHGVDISGLRARQIAGADFTRFGHIYALDHGNLIGIRRLAPQGATASVGLLLDLVEGRAGQEVADPYYGGDEGFEQTWADVSAAALALVERLRR
jgi:protein-tyrosine phosphatase